MAKATGGVKPLAAAERDALLAMLKARFESHSRRHRGLTWAAVEKRLVANPAKLWSLAEMERTGGEPDVVGQDAKSGEFVFCDCAEESPKVRRSVCYDGEALRSRQENKPRASALELAAAMGIEVLDEEGYRELQRYGTATLPVTAPGRGLRVPLTPGGTLVVESTRELRGRRGPRS